MDEKIRQIEALNVQLESDLEAAQEERQEVIITPTSETCKY